ncbi:hypothetical protein HDU96_008138 [Phlyctochytrium bullatum]|nr:hypothetical protein HDU96_008138 [Phlyctochytrium bullatum]
MLEAVLDRLLNENLHGPTSPYNPQNAGRPGGARPRSGVEEDSWVVVQDQQDDLDAKDPRWLELFIEYFLEMETTSYDDLLFFVRQQDHLEPDQDPIFVKRKVNKTMPALNDLIDWKQTFFLNLIIQLPCTLTVAVCRRSSANADGAKKKSLLAKPSEERVVVVGGPSAATGGGEEGTELKATGTAPRPNGGDAGEETPYGSNASLGAARPSNNPAASTPTSPKPASRSRMIALRRITKKVYAAPYKSRMDIKDAFMNEISYPLVYYTVNDYESYDLHLEIREREYLCVELSVPLPNDASKKDLSEAIAAISIEEDSSPFPVPAGHSKIILFQGAVPFSSLLDIYQQKGLAAQSQLRSSWSKLVPDRREGPFGPSGAPLFAERTEYIMMRGPHGKGQCQVSIREYLQQAEQSEEVPTSPTPQPKGPTTISDRLRMIGSTVRAGINAVTGSSAPPPPQTTLRKPETLVCSMTYVNVPWQSITSYIHGFLGSDESFEAFPEHLMACLTEVHGVPRECMEAVVYPCFETKGSNQLKVRQLVDWLLLNATTVRAERVVLLAHSMGGLLAADAYQVMYGVGDLGVKARQNAKALKAAREKARQQAKSGSFGWLFSGIKAAHSAGVNMLRSVSNNSSASSLKSKHGDGTPPISANPDEVKSETGESKKESETASSEDKATVSNESIETPNQDPNQEAEEGSWEQALPEDEFDIDASMTRILINIKGIITFDSPFYGLSSTVITSAGAGKVVNAIGTVSTQALTLLNGLVSTVPAMQNAAGIGTPSFSLPAGWSFPGGTEAMNAANEKLEKPHWMKEDGGQAEALAEQAELQAKAKDQNDQNSRENGNQKRDVSSDGAEVNDKAMVLASSKETETKKAPPAKPSEWTWTSIAIAGAGAAAGLYVASGLLPVAAQVIPARTLIQGAVTQWAFQQAEEVRSHAEFLYPLINTVGEMQARVQALLDEMEKEKRLHYHGFYLELPPLGIANDQNGQQNDDSAKQSDPSIDSLPDDLNKIPDVSPSQLPRNFCVPPPLKSSHVFETVNSPLADEIDSHMHMFNASMNQGDYIRLVLKTATQIITILSSP